MAKNNKSSKKSAPKPAKPAVKKAVAAKKPAPKPVAKEVVVAKKPAAPAKPVPAALKAAAKKSARDDLRNRILGRKVAKPIAFSLDEVREIAKSNTGKVSITEKTGKPAAKASTGTKLLEPLKPSAKPAHVKAASLMDILGFNPKKAAPKRIENDPEKVPEKYRRYFKLLLDLHSHLFGQLDQHSEDTLKRSSKDDSGDLSSYGQHMADAGTDTFDRDFALSMVANEQEALSEIDAAIKRIHDGTYGICEVTGKPITKERLIAVPFTRYSAEALKEIEKNRYRTRTQAGLFGELGEEGAKLSENESGGGGEE
ncbi:MAG TPA: TraR/DksA C4-type zinc finger protein [Opitutaceae bacterium]|jgi:RNA polymerase-binding transcription factor DksA|nr:TraR/DksA C4-type zinc finger protein [Opitutaceae bacterium]